MREENTDITFVILLQELPKLKRKTVFMLLCLGNVLGLNLHKFKDNNGCNLLRLHDLKYYKHRDPVCTCITGSLRN